MYAIKHEADSEGTEEEGGEGVPCLCRRPVPLSPSSLGSFSPPICIGADLLTEALTGVAFYCTGKQKH